MASIEDIKARVDLHDLAGRLGLERPQRGGNYRSPHHEDRNPSLSIYEDGTQQKWKDHSAETGGDCIDLVQFVLGLDNGEAIKWLREEYALPADPPAGQKPDNRPKSRAEWIAERCFGEGALDRAKEYLTGRGIAEEAVERAWKKGAIGWNSWTSPKVSPGEFGYGGEALATVVRTFNPGHVVAVDMRYLDPEQNGGVKTQTQGEKKGYPWTSDIKALQKAETVYLVESAVNALSVETAGLRRTAAVAIRGAGNAPNIDLRFLQGKRVVICLDHDDPDNYGRCAGQEAAWSLHERLTAANVAAHLVDQGPWEEEFTDVNDILQELGPQELNRRLQDLDRWAIPGVRTDAAGKGRPRIWLPNHDFQQFWRYQALEDFTRFVQRVEQDENGEPEYKWADLCGFRVAAISRVSVASATATMTGEEDAQPHHLFAVSVQTPRHRQQLLRKVFDDDQLHNTDKWQKLGPVFAPVQFKRFIYTLERGAEIGARNAVNFVGLAWQEGRPVVNEGPDTYFTEPEKQCPYHNLTFPAGSRADARRVIEAYQETFRSGQALLVLAWALGGHLKAFLGQWPHMEMQAEKGAGKSTLIKHLERTIAFTMFSGQSLQTEFRLLTSTSCTSHPVGWEELSARGQQVIDKAVGLLQECFQYSVTRRGSEMTEYVTSAPVLLAGEDVPVRSLTGKLTRVQLRAADQGPHLPDGLPRFPVRDWLSFLAEHSRDQVKGVYNRALAYCRKHCRASGTDAGAQRMVENYASVLTAWGLLADFADIDLRQGDFPAALVAEMNAHIAETSADREPWVWILETLFGEIAAGQYRHPYAVRRRDGVDCLVLRPAHVMHHLKHNNHLRDTFNALPVKSDRVLKSQLKQAGVVHEERVDITIGSTRHGHMLGLSLPALEEYGLHLPRSEDPSEEVSL
ncbi:MAG: toprim domain-containing protein [Thiohalorhabdus sp.]|uniref:toprim domain-containing protein n=1 Tax=Thiohalorhabdus sp. TaxID=3094134 RepID=UPI00398131E5